MRTPLKAILLLFSVGSCSANLQIGVSAQEVSTKQIDPDSTISASVESVAEATQGSPDAEGRAISDAEILEALLRLQGAARAGSREGLLSVLDASSFRRLETPDSSEYNLDQILKLFPVLQHPARFVSVTRLGDSSIYEGMLCRQVILPRDQGRYSYLDGEIEEPFRYKQIDFWACFHRNEGALKVFLSYPLNDLLCLIQ